MKVSLSKQSWVKVSVIISSRLYRIGKRTAIKKYDTCQHFREQAKLFHASSTVDEFIAAGENALVSLYNGKSVGDVLDILRYRRYYEKLASKKSQIQPHNLLPTSAAAKYHSMRVYLLYKCNSGKVRTQLCKWKIWDGRLASMTSRPVAKILCWGVRISRTGTK